MVDQITLNELLRKTAITITTPRSSRSFALIQDNACPHRWVLDSVASNLRPSFVYGGRGTNASSLLCGILTQRRSVTIPHAPNERKCMSFLDNNPSEGCLCLKGKRSHLWPGRMSVVNLDKTNFHLPLAIARPTYKFQHLVFDYFIVLQLNNDLTCSTL